MSTTVDLGFLSLNRPIFKDGFMPGGSQQTDIYKFQTGFINAKVVMQTFSPLGSNIPSSFALSLFRDSNGNGFLDNGDSAVQISDGTSDINNAFEEIINNNLSRDTYFVRARGFDSESFSYRFLIERTTQGAANPFTNKEIPLGQISQDLQKTNRISDTDTADNFAFTLDGKSSLNIDVRELANKNRDANVRVVQDLNDNGYVDKNEVVAKGISTRGGSLDSITELQNAGDYILQVCQTKGNTKFEVNFDHSAA